MWFSRWGPQRIKPTIRSNTMSDFPSFDTLLKMAQERPDELEKFRLEQIDLLINQAPEHSRNRLKGLQFQIDAQRSLHKDSHMGACLKISQMMHESLAELRGWLNSVSGTHDPLRQEMDEFQNDRKQDAKVLAFPAS